MSSNYPLQLQILNASYTKNQSEEKTFTLTVKYDWNVSNNNYKMTYNTDHNVYIKFTTTDNVTTNLLQYSEILNYPNGTLVYSVTGDQSLPDNIMRVEAYIWNKNNQPLSYSVGNQQTLISTTPEVPISQPSPTWVITNFSSDMKYENFDLSGTIFAEKTNEFDDFYVNQPLKLFLQAKNNEGIVVYLQEFSFTFGNNQQFSQGINNIFISNDQILELELYVIGSNGVYSQIRKTTLQNIDTTDTTIPDGYHLMPDGSIMADSDMPIITYCVNVYDVRDDGSVYSTPYSAITAERVQELQLTKLVISCEADYLPTNKQVQEFYGFTPPPSETDTTINSTMISQSIGAFILKDGRVKGEILYIANQSFNSFYYNKSITSIVQIKSKSGVVIAIKSNNLNFTETERDERIIIDESAGNFKELSIDFFVWDSPLSMRIFSETKQIQIVDETDVADPDPFDPQPPVTTCPTGFHKDFSGTCVPDDPAGQLPRDKLIDTLKGFLFGTVALSLLARKY